MDQSRWMQLMPSPIGMDVIDAIIVRRQSARGASPSNATRKAVHGGLTDKLDKGVVSNTTKLIPRRGQPSQVRQSPRRKHEERDHEAR